MKNIAIVGAGIIGMSTAYQLLEKDHKITVYAEAFSPDITSARAAAFWFPYHILNDDRCIRWSQGSYEKYTAFSADPATGISQKRLLKVVKQEDVEADMSWIDFMPAGSCRPLNANELMDGFRIGHEVYVPLIETQQFLPWLRQHLEQQGVKFKAQQVKSLDELSGQYHWVINCSGLGARELCQDTSIYPARGQVALIGQQKDMPLFLIEEQPFYIVARQDATIIGGTYEEGIWDLATESGTIQRLYQQAVELFPELGKFPLIGSWSGLRPFRPVIRVEKEANSNIIHNYGHGGSGFTLAWGCAAEVADMIS